MRALCLMQIFTATFLLWGRDSQGFGADGSKRDYASLVHELQRRGVQISLLRPSTDTRAVRQHFSARLTKRQINSKNGRLLEHLDRECGCCPYLSRETR